MWYFSTTTRYVVRKIYLQFNFLTQNLSKEWNFFQWNGKVTRIYLGKLSLSKFQYTTYKISIFFIIGLWKNTKKIHTLFTICCWGRRRERRKRVRKTGSQIELRIVSRISSRRKTKIRQSLCQNKRTWRRQWRWRKIPSGCGNFL